MAIGDGLYIAVQFSKDLVGDVSGNEDYFIVTAPVYDMVPGGTLNPAKRIPVESVSRYPGTQNTLLLSFAPGNQNSLQTAAGDITVRYAGGTLQGNGWAIADFAETFTPEDIAFKGNQNDLERVTFSVSAQASLLAIQYLSGYSEQGHVALSGVTASGTLTHVHDI